MRGKEYALSDFYYVNRKEDGGFKNDFYILDSKDVIKAQLDSCVWLISCVKQNFVNTFLNFTFLDNK